MMAQSQPETRELAPGSWPLLSGIVYCEHPVSVKTNLAMVVLAHRLTRIHALSLVKISTTF
jgi:hypothetical protein